jgi:preprotein translocase subunit SecY
LIFIGWAIDKKGIGNGISIILLINILSGLPKDLSVLIEMFIKGKTIAKGTLSGVIVAAIVLGVIVLVVLLNESYRKIPVQYAQKTTGNRVGIPQKSFLPVKLNTSSVIPVIFASSLFSIPQIILTFLGQSNTNFFLMCLNQSNWFNTRNPEYTLGFVLYALLIYFFAYFYTSITFNPIEIADNLKKQGGVIPGIRQGKPTELYLKGVINRVTIIGATGLLIVTLIPTICSCVFGVTLSLGGTSIIIVVGVILETLESLDSQLQSRNYRSFLLG